MTSKQLGFTLIELLVVVVIVAILFTYTTLAIRSNSPEDLINEVLKAVEEGERVLVTTLTKRMSEDLSSYLRERSVRVEYLHSDIDAIGSQ